MFEKDLKDWKAIEREFASRLMKWDVSKIEFSQWQFADWDVKATIKKNWLEVERTYEVKDDKVSPTSWNVWFEFRYNWKPSGIFTSKADIIVYHIQDDFYYEDRNELLIKLCSIPKTEIKWWDNDKSDMYLVSNLYLDKLFKKL
jgi:hypothetical protein